MLWAALILRAWAKNVAPSRRVQLHLREAKAKDNGAAAQAQLRHGRRHIAERYRLAPLKA